MAESDFPIIVCPNCQRMHYRNSESQLCPLCLLITSVRASEERAGKYI